MYCYTAVVHEQCCVAGFGKIEYVTEYDQLPKQLWWRHLQLALNITRLVGQAAKLLLTGSAIIRTGSTKLWSPLS
jgi:hypothetical protein